MEQGTDPYLYLNRNDEAVVIFNSLEVETTDNEVRRPIVRHLTNDYEI